MADSDQESFHSNSSTNEDEGNLCSTICQRNDNER
jgi:hypothetical protein